MHNEQVTARLGKNDGYTVNLQAGSHQIVSDEPVALGGAGFGASPYELLLASLGSCTTMTLHMYARRKKWQLDDVEVELAHKKVHRDDCTGCDKASSKIDVITRHIRLTGELDEVQRLKLIEIADKCPVHRTLMGNIQVTTKELRRVDGKG